MTAGSDALATAQRELAEELGCTVPPEVGRYRAVRTVSCRAHHSLSSSFSSSCVYMQHAGSGVAIYCEGFIRDEWRPVHQQRGPGGVLGERSVTCPAAMLCGGDARLAAS